MVYGRAGIHETFSMRHRPPYPVHGLDSYLPYKTGGISENVALLRPQNSEQNRLEGIATSVGMGWLYLLYGIRIRNLQRRQQHEQGRDKEL